MIVGPEGQIMSELGSGEETCLLEADLKEVDRVRSRGIKGLGQPLKSFRDSPLYFENDSNLNYLESIGTLEIPNKIK